MRAIETIVCARAVSADIGQAVLKATAGTPGVMEAVAELWVDTHRGVDVGIWECTPGRFSATRDGYSEICVLLSGRVTLEVEGQKPIPLCAGDTFVTPSGWRGTWHVHETVRKIYVIVADER